MPWPKDLNACPLLPWLPVLFYLIMQLWRGPKEPRLILAESKVYGQESAGQCPRSFGRVAIFFVFTDYKQYGHASNTLRCYGASRGYETVAVQPFENERVQAS
jgi:hypothetical protein